MPGRKLSLQTIRGQLDERARREQDIRVRVVEGPTENGFWNVHGMFGSEESEVVASGQGRVSYRPGSLVLTGMNGNASERKTIISLPPAGLQGAAQFSFPVLVGARKDAVGIASADPNTLEAGAVEETVTLTGFGFLADPLDAFRAVVYNATTKVWDDDPLVTLGAPTWVSFTEVTIPVSVSYSAPAGYQIRMEVVRA